MNALNGELNKLRKKGFFESVTCPACRAEVRGDEVAEYAFEDYTFKACEHCKHLIPRYRALNNARLDAGMEYVPFWQMVRGLSEKYGSLDSIQERSAS